MLSQSEMKSMENRNYITGIIPYSWTSSYSWVLENSKGKELNGIYTWRDAKAVLNMLTFGTQYIAPTECDVWVLVRAELKDHDFLTFAIVKNPAKEAFDVRIGSAMDGKERVYKAIINNSIVRINKTRFYAKVGRAFYEELMNNGVAIVRPSLLGDNGIPDNMAVLSKEAILEIFDGKNPFTGFQDNDNVYRYTFMERLVIAQNFFHKVEKSEKNDKCKWKLSAYIDYTSTKNKPQSKYVRFDTFNGIDVKKDVMIGMPHLIDNLADKIKKEYDLNDDDFYVSCSYCENTVSIQLIMLGLGKIWSKEIGLYNGGTGMIYVPAFEFEYKENNKKYDSSNKKDLDSAFSFKSKKFYYGLYKSRKDNSFRICSYFADPSLERKLGQMSVKRENDILSILSEFSDTYADFIVNEEFHAVVGGGDYGKGFYGLFETLESADKKASRKSKNIISVISDPDVDVSDEEIEKAENANEKLFIDTLEKRIMEDMKSTTVLKGIDQGKIRSIAAGAAKLSHFNKGSIFTQKHILNAIGCMVVQLKGFECIMNTGKNDIETKSVGLYVTTNGEKSVVTKVKTWTFKNQD